MRIDKFLGEVHDVPRQALEADEFQEDKGGQRYDTLRWKRRKGMRHTDTLVFSSAISTVFGFDLPGTDFAQIIIDGANIYGIRNITEHS